MEQTETKMLKRATKSLNEIMWSLGTLPKDHPARQATRHLGNALHVIVTGEEMARLKSRKPKALPVASTEETAHPELEFNAVVESEVTHE